MTNEINEVKVQQDKKCFCQSEGVRNFLIVSLGTFVGGFCAISLFAALHKPPMMPMMPMMHRAHMGHHHMMGHHPMMKHNCDCPCHKKMMKKHFEKKAEFVKKMKEKKELGDKE